LPLRQDEGGGEIAAGGRISLRRESCHSRSEDADDSNGRRRQPSPKSLPGIARPKTRVNALMPRQSIHLCKDFLAKKMDARVKPAHDESRTTRPRAGACTPGAGSGKSHGADSIRPRSRHILMRLLAEWSSARRGAERGYQHDLS